MYVEEFLPPGPVRPVPLVLVHGGGQSGACWHTTPDGRPGWAELFASFGHHVYVLDQPARGRSAFQPTEHGATVQFTAEAVERLFTSPASFADWPEAALHTQWPGSGRIGDPVFDRFYAAQMPFLADFGESEQVFRDAGARLLELIGPAILVTHSQSGPMGWALADERPDLVRGIVAVEPFGPPFARPTVGVERVGVALDGALTGSFEWGVTATSMLFAPPGDASTLERSWTDQGAAGRRPGAATPLPALANLRAVPALVVTGDASYHASYDHLTVDFLRRCQVPVSALRLGDQGITGNGHMMMLELNNEEIARAIHRWLAALPPEIEPGRP